MRSSFLDQRVYRLNVPSREPNVFLLGSFSFEKGQVVDLGLLEKGETFSKLPIFENLLVGYRSVPWQKAKPFILQILMRMSRGTLFVDVPSIWEENYSSPSEQLRDISECVRAHSYSLLPQVRLVFLIRPFVVEHMFRKLELLCLQELEKIHLEIELSSFCGVLFVESDAFRLVSEAILLEEALRSRRSLYLLLKEKLGYEEDFFKVQIKRLHQLEHSYLLNPKSIMDNKDFVKLLEAVFPL